MKFGKYLETNRVPEWDPAYVRYKHLKKILKAVAKIQQEQPWSPASDAGTSTRASSTRGHASQLGGGGGGQSPAGAAGGGAERAYSPQGSRSSDESSADSAETPAFGPASQGPSQHVASESHGSTSAAAVPPLSITIDEQGEGDEADEEAAAVSVPLVNPEELGGGGSGGGSGNSGSSDQPQPPLPPPHRARPASGATPSSPLAALKEVVVEYADQPIPVGDDAAVRAMQAHELDGVAAALASDAADDEEDEGDGDGFKSRASDATDDDDDSGRRAAEALARRASGGDGGGGPSLSAMAPGGLGNATTTKISPKVWPLDRVVREIEKLKSEPVPDRFGPSLPVPAIEDFVSYLPPDLPAFYEEQYMALYLLHEMLKSANFYHRQEQFFLLEASRLAERAAAFRQHRTRIEASLQHSSVGAKEKRAKLRVERKLLDKHVRELYRGTTLLDNFRDLNYTALVKFVKKYRKTSVVGELGRDAFLPYVENVAYHTSRFSSVLAARIEELYASTFAKGDRKLAMRRLRVFNKQHSHWNTFRLGFAAGICFVLTCFLVGLNSVVDTLDSYAWFLTAFPVYRALALTLIAIFYWGVLGHVLDKVRINRSFIFHIDQRSELTPIHVLEVCSSLSLLFFLNIGCYFFVNVWDRDNEAGDPPWLVSKPGYIHFTLFVFYFFLMFLPVKRLHYHTRMYFLRTLARVVVAPFRFVAFEDFFLGDQLCSVVPLMVDYCYGICIYTTGAFTDDSYETCESRSRTFKWVVSFLPYWWRLMQCLRRYKSTADQTHLWNAGKYSSSMMVTLCSLLSSRFDDYPGLRVLWICAAVVGTAYTYTWDIYMDWGFGRRNAKNWMLRDKLLLDRTFIYYAVMLLNLALRVAWVLTVSPAAFGITLRQDYFTLLIALAEITRRNIWNYFRLENEHLNNCGNFRVIDVIPPALQGQSRRRLGDTSTDDDEADGADSNVRELLAKGLKAQAQQAQALQPPSQHVAALAKGDGYQYMRASTIALGEIRGFDEASAAAGAVGGSKAGRRLRRRPNAKKAKPTAAAARKATVASGPARVTGATATAPPAATAAAAPAAGNKRADRKRTASDSSSTDGEDDDQGDGRTAAAAAAAATAPV